MVRLQLAIIMSVGLALGLVWLSPAGAPVYQTTVSPTASLTATVSTSATITATVTLSPTHTATVNTTPSPTAVIVTPTPTQAGVLASPTATELQPPAPTEEIAPIDATPEDETAPPEDNSGPTPTFRPMPPIPSLTIVYSPTPGLLMLGPYSHASGPPKSNEAAWQRALRTWGGPVVLGAVWLGLVVWFLAAVVLAAPRRDG